MASSCLVLADEGSMSRLSSPHESSPCFVTLLLHLEVISSYRAAMFSLGKGVEGNGGASHLSSSSKPSLFPAPISLTPAFRKALPALLGQFHWATGQKCLGDPPLLAGSHSHLLPASTLPWRDFPLLACIVPPSCKEEHHGHFFGYREECSSTMGGVG